MRFWQGGDEVHGDVSPGLSCHGDRLQKPILFVVHWVVTLTGRTGVDEVFYILFHLRKIKCFLKRVVGLFHTPMTLHCWHVVL